MSNTKTDLAVLGVKLLHSFCELNEILPPRIHLPCTKEDAHFEAIRRLGCTGFYRHHIGVVVAVPCTASMNPMYSWPSYISDRTAYGVIQHELGHYIEDWYKEIYKANIASSIKKETGEKPITSYHPNDSEWFAEIFRLFVTNPTLLKEIRPKTYASLVAKNFKPLQTKSYTEVLKGFNAPPKIFIRLAKTMGVKDPNREEVFNLFGL